MSSTTQQAVDEAPAGFAGYVQVAYIVPDAEQAARQWLARGAGPFFRKRYTTEGEVTYRGQPATLDHISLFGQYGTMMLELIQPLGEVHSVYRDHSGDGDHGLHHFARICPDLQAAVAEAEAQGYPKVCPGGTPQTPVAFVDARHELGHMIELCQDAPSLRFLYRLVADAARDWDGSDPIRELVPSGR